MKKIMNTIGFIILLCIIYFLGAGEMIWYPNVTPRCITNIIVSVSIIWFLYKKEINRIIYNIGTWFYKTDKKQKMNDISIVSKALVKLLLICILFIVLKIILFFTTFVSIVRKSALLETVKLSCILIGIGILIPIVYYIEYQDKKLCKIK